MADPDDYDTRRTRLRAALDKHEAEEAAERARQDKGSLAGYAAAFRLSTEFISAIAVGGILGYLADWALGTTPWLMIVLFLLGFVAGILNVLRSAGLVAQPRPRDKPSGGGRADDATDDATDDTRAPK